MDIRDIMGRINDVYDGDGTIFNYWDGGKGKPRKVPLHGGGDTLAKFIVQEVFETHDPDATDEDQLGEAARQMQRAADQIAGVVDALSQAVTAKRVYGEKPISKGEDET